MIVSTIDLFQYKIRLNSLLRVKDQILEYREGIILRMCDQQGNTGLGEVAPLPGFHRENKKTVTTELHSIIPLILEKEIPESILTLNGNFDNHFSDFSLSPSTRFGLELGLLNLCASIRHRPLYALLGVPQTKLIYINGLITVTPEYLNTEVPKLVEEGYQTIKLKVGQQEIENEIETVRSVREMVGPHLKLRLDANRAWSLTQAIKFGKAVRNVDIEYIEEPVNDLSALQTFYRETGLPYALDESLSYIPPENLKTLDGLRAIILKPSFLGGLEKTAQLCQLAKSYNILPVLSCAFYSGLTLSALGQFAAVYTHPQTAHGLDTYKWFSEDILEIPFKTENGQINLDALVEMGDKIREDIIKPISND